MRRRLFWILGGLGGYVLLLALLCLTERGAEGATILTPADALWYSLVTMTTVGYGDLAPVTTVGKIIGTLFLMLSLGFLALLVSVSVSALTGALRPRLLLWRVRGRNWYLFSTPDEDGALLAQQLLAEQPDTACVFCAAPETRSERSCVWVPWSLETMLARRGRRKQDVILFFQPDEIAAVDAAVSLEGCGLRCVRAEEGPETLPDDVILFSPQETTARHYWLDHPLGPAERELVLIGDGPWARELLERGLLNNILPPDRRVVYHLFGDWSAWQRRHPALDRMVWIDTPGQGDGVVFHREPFDADPALLQRADRLILCADSDSENLRLCWQLKADWPLTGAVHLRLERLQLPDSFGSRALCLTPDAVLRQSLSRTARQMHEIYCAGSKNAPTWESLSRFTRSSNIAAADHLYEKVRFLLPEEDVRELTGDLFRRAYDAFLALDPEGREICRSMEHRRWCRFHWLHNWQYAEKRDNARRRHPCLIPYEDLSAAEQAKDDFAWELLGKLAEHAGA